MDFFKVNSFNMDYKFFIIGIMHFMLTLIGDQYIFVHIGEHWAMYLFIKVLVLILLVGVWQRIGECLQAYKREKTIPIYERYFLLYFSFLMLLLACIWPGNWFWDDIEIFNYARSFTLLFWQHKLTGIFHIFSLAIFPFAAGVIIMQSFFAACIFASLMCKFRTIFSNSKMVNLFILPFLTMPILFQVMFPLRMTLFSFLTLYVLFEICYLMKRREKVDSSTIYKMMFLTAILSAWRTEAILYLALIPILLLVCLKKQFVLQSFIKGVAILFIGYAGLYFFQYYDVAQSSRDHYFYTGVINPLNQLVKKDLRGKHLEENLNAIDKIIKLELLKKYETGEKAFFSEPTMIHKDATSEEKKNFQRGYIRLVYDNFGFFAEERFDSFMKSNLRFMILDFSKSEFERHKEFDELPLNQPFSRSLREVVMNFLGGEKSISSFLYQPYGYALLLIVIFIIATFYKEKFLVLFSLSLLFHLFAVIFTAPAYFHMYYFTFQLCAYVGVIYLICEMYEKAHVVKRF